MQQEKKNNAQEAISMEEYLWKRQKIRENKEKKSEFVNKKEKSPAWMLAELYV